MISLEEAQARINRDIGLLPIIEVPLADALGLVLQQDVVANEPIPPFDNTAMDGFAIRAADSSIAGEDSPVTLPVVATVAAGSVAPRRLEAGEAMRIMTGAPIPDGADAVIMVELTRPAGEADSVELLAPVPVGNHVRPAGDDLAAGTVVFGAGTLITPGHIGVMASVGVSQVAVRRRARVGVFSTGDELVDAGVPLAHGQIRDSNRPTLLALLREAGVEGVDLGRLPDDEAKIDAALRAAVDPSSERPVDALLTSGGVSMGDFDFVKKVLSELGELNWMQVAIKPAKPLAFGLLFGIPVFGLPGNPVSSVVSFELFARPAIRSMMGLPQPERRSVWAIADEPLLRSPDGKVHFQRVVVDPEPDGSWRARSAGGQGSHQLSALASANGFAVLPDGEGVGAGQRVRVLQLDS